MKKPLLAGVMGLGLLLGGTPQAHALTRAQAEAIIASQPMNAETAAFIRSLIRETTISPISSSIPTFTRNLFVGSTGQDVTALQNFLIEQGHLTMPPGVTKGYFGSVTQRALAQYQKAHGISPAAGYFGPLTMNRINSSLSAVNNQGSTNTTNGSTTTSGNQSNTNDNSLRGGDGEIRDFDILGTPSNEYVSENENVKVLGFEFEANDSDIRIDRVDVNFEAISPIKESRPWKLIDSVAIYKGSTKVGEVIASNKSAWKTKNNVHTVRISNLNTSRSVVRENATEQFYIEVTAAKSIDSADMPQKFNLAIADKGLRATDARGTILYQGDQNDKVVMTFEENTSGSLEVTMRTSDNTDRTERVDAEVSKSNIDILKFKVASDDMDSTIEDIRITVATSTNTSESLNALIKNLSLFADGRLIKSKSISNNAGGVTSITFDRLNYDIDENDEVEFIVRADINKQNGNFANGSGIKATLVSVEGEDEKGDDITETINKSAGTVTFYTEGIGVELVGSPSATKVFTADDSGEKDRVEYAIKFKVTAFGNDVFIDKSVTESALASLTAGNGIGWSTTQQSTGTYTVSSQILDATGSTIDDTSDAFLVGKNDSRTFTLKVTLEASSDGAQAIQLTGINWDTDGTTDTTADNYYSTNLNDYKTELVPLNVQ